MKPESLSQAPEGIIKKMKMSLGPQRLGKFGDFVKEYERARRSYPLEVFRYFQQAVDIKNPFILDLGCGTGISTRQLVSLGRVVGCDPDSIMLTAARGHKTPTGIKYVVGKANKLPFRDAVFDVVTAFAAFHWFNDKKSIAEIRRVLKPGGIVFIVNRTGLRSWGEGYRMAIIKSIGQEVAAFREDLYKPERDLKGNGFKKNQVKSWRYTELYTLSNALQYVQSISIWNSVPKQKRQQALLGVKKYFEKMLKRTNKIERKLTVKVVIGRK